MKRFHFSPVLPWPRPARSARKHRPAPGTHGSRPLLPLALAQQLPALPSRTAARTPSSHARSRRPSLDSCGHLGAQPVMVAARDPPRIRASSSWSCSVAGVGLPGFRISGVRSLMPHDGVRHVGFLELGNFFGRQLELQGGKGVVQMAGLGARSRGRLPRLTSSRRRARRDSTGSSCEVNWTHPGGCNRGVAGSGRRADAGACCRLGEEV